MSRAPAMKAARGVGILLMLVAWIVVSNHCAIAGMEHRAGISGGATAQKPCCPSQGKPLHDQPPGLCCKSLRALPAEGAKLVAAPDAAPTLESFWAALLATPSPEAQEPDPRRAHSPPETLSFAEVVLQRSLLTHAPPLLA